MTFKEATDRLINHGVTLAAIAEAFGVAMNTIARARMDPQNPNARTPPPGWQAVLRRLAKQRGEELLTLVAELEHEIEAEG